MAMALISKDEMHPFEIGYVSKYHMGVKTPETSLAKSYEEENRMEIELEIPKAVYQEEAVQTLLDWIKMGYSDNGYYRELALHITETNGYERTIAFTHAEVNGSITFPSQEDYVKVEMVINQKADKQVGVAFGEELEETLAKAWDRVNNPPRLNIFVPVGEELMYAAYENKVNPLPKVYAVVYDKSILKESDGGAQPFEYVRMLELDRMYQHVYEPQGNELMDAIMKEMDKVRRMTDCYPDNYSSNYEYKNPGSKKYEVKLNKIQVYGEESKTALITEYGLDFIDGLLTAGVLSFAKFVASLDGKIESGDIEVVYYIYSYYDEPVIRYNTKITYDIPYSFMGRYRLHKNITFHSATEFTGKAQYELVDYRTVDPSNRVRG